MRKITCHCEQTFSVDLPETVNLDEKPDIIKDIADGSFLTCICPACEAELHTDLETDILWPSKKTKLRLIPELERFSFMSGKKKIPKDFQIVIGYPELADRIAVLQDNLDPLSIEALKYHLLEKAAEMSPEGEPSVYFEKLTDSGDLEFHMHGIKNGEVAVSIIPYGLYEKIKTMAETQPENELFSALKNGPYVSVQNVFSENNGD